METGHRSGGGASGGGGYLCSACGYQYPNPHPSAKHRRAHRKNCGKPPSAAAAAVERDGDRLLLGEGEGRRGGGEGNGARAADGGGGSPGSAPDVADAVENEDSAEYSSPSGTGCQDIIDKVGENRLIVCNDLPSKIAPNDNEIQTEVATEFSENAPRLDDGYPSQPAFSSDQYQDASASVLPPEPEEHAGFSSEFSVDEKINLNVMSLASSAAAGEDSAHTNDTAVCPEAIAITEVDCMTNSIGKDKTSEETMEEVSEVDSSYQEKPQSIIVEGTVEEEDTSANHIRVVSKEETPGEETEPKEESELILTNSAEEVSTIKEHANLLGSKEFCAEKLVCADETNSDDLFESASGGYHLEAADVKHQQLLGSISMAEDQLAISKQMDIVEPQQFADSTSGAADQLTISKQMNIKEGNHYPDSDEVFQAVSSLTGSAVGAEVICASSAANLTKNTCLSEVTTVDVAQDNVSHTSGVIVTPSQVDLTELNTYPTSHEIDMVISKDDIEENRQNENISADLATCEINEVQNIDVKEKQQNEDSTPYAASHETNEECRTCNFGENKHDEIITTEASCHMINIVQSTSSIEEKEQIQEVIADSASDKIAAMSSRDIGEDQKNSEACMDAIHKINVACIENAEGEIHNEEITADPTAENNAMTFPSTVELKENEETIREKKPNEENTATDAINLICSPDSEDTKQNEGITEDHSSHEIVPDIVKENNAMLGTTSCKIDVVSTTYDDEEKRENEGIINVVHTIDDAKEKRIEEPISDPAFCNINTESNTDVIEEKRQYEETTTDPSSHKNGVARDTDNAEGMNQNKDAAADPIRNEIAPAHSTDDAEEKKRKGEVTAAKEISTTHITDDLRGNHESEEIADKEVIVDTDKNHVSLKALLTEKVVEAKEKKASTKDRVLPFRRRAPSKDNAPSPTKPGSPIAGSGHEDWNSPARLPAEKKPKGKKQQWVPFICCPSIH